MSDDNLIFFLLKVIWSFCSYSNILFCSYFFKWVEYFSREGWVKSFFLALELLPRLFFAKWLKKKKWPAVFLRLVSSDSLFCFDIFSPLILVSGPVPNQALPALLLPGGAFSGSACGLSVWGGCGIPCHQSLLHHGALSRPMNWVLSISAT